MGLDPGSLALIGMLGSAGIGALSGGDGQELQSNEGIAGIDPRQLLGESKGLLSDLLSSLIDDANKGTSLETRVQPLPGFAGGALPFAIGAGGKDPGIKPTPGAGINKRTLSNTVDSGNGIPQRYPGQNPSGDADYTGRVAIPRNQSLRTAATLAQQQGDTLLTQGQPVGDKVGESVRGMVDGAPPVAKGGGDIEQAQAAADVLDMLMEGQQEQGGAEPPPLKAVPRVGQRYLGRRKLSA